MQINTRDLHFFHGTGALAATGILLDGARNPLDQMGWRSLASDLWSALLKLGTEEELNRWYLEGPDLYNSPGLVALRSAHACEEGHLFVYGHFFATLNIAHAYRYALSPHRSEFLSAISVGVRILERRGAASTSQELGNEYPDIFKLINKPPPPVVLELTNVDDARLTNENGSKIFAQQLESFLDLADDNELGGVPVVLRDAPLGTYLGWNITAGGFRKGQICNYEGGMISFAKTKAERLESGDPRPSLEERYKDHSGYVAAVDAAAHKAMAAGFLLEKDAKSLIAAAEASDVLK